MPVWKRTLWSTALAQMLCIVGFNFVLPFLPLFVQQLGVHGQTNITLWAGLLGGGSAICMAVSSPIWGVLADRHGRKIMLVRAVFSAAVLIGLSSLVQNVYELLALRMLQGVFTGTVTASQALVSSQVPKERLGFSLGVMQTAVYLGSSLGPLGGGLVADALGFRFSFAMAGCILLIAGVLITFLVEEEKRPVREVSAARQSFWRGMGDAINSSAVLAMAAAMFAVNFGVTVVFPILPQFVQMLQGPGGHDAALTGLVFTAAGVAGAISSVVTGSFADRIGYQRVIVTAAIIAAILSVPQYFVNATWQLAVLRILIGLALGAILPSASALIASLVPPEKRGTAYGLMGSATSLGFGVGPLTAAGVVAVAGIRAVFLTAAVLLAFIALWVGSMVHVPTAAPSVAEPRRREPGPPMPAGGGAERGARIGQDSD